MIAAFAVIVVELLYVIIPTAHRIFFSTIIWKDQERPLPYTFFAIQAKKLNIKYIQGCKLLEHNVVSSPVILEQVLVSQLMGNPTTTTK